jgi:hypothetical protein
MAHSIKKRIAVERRVANRNVTFPLRDNSGIMITHDRRARCDRRAPGLEVTETELSEEAYQELLEQFEYKGL